MNDVVAPDYKKSKERTFLVGDLTFAAQEWGMDGDLPMLALHGWLDNSASFTPVARLMKGVHLMAVDLAGHGKSSHRKGAAAYNIWQDIGEIFAIADQLGWKQFALLGHSRGGVIATLAAGTFPERITHLTLIEGFVPESAQAEYAPRQLALSISGIKLQMEKKPTVYPSEAVAIAVREKGITLLGYEAAKLLVERGGVDVDGGYIWSTDPRLLAPSEVKLLPEQIAAFLGSIQSPVKLILGADGLPRLRPNKNPFVSLIPQIEVLTLDGGHHLHLDDNVESVVQVLNKFLSG